MTEEEAKTKVCPRTMGPSGSLCAPCIASDCMAWRWYGVLSNGTRHDSPEAAWAAKHPELPPASGGMNQGDTPLGYCGLARAP